MADKFLLIDGSSLIHRAFFALPPLTNKKGVNTGAVYGFCNMLLKLLLDIQPQYVAVAFDRSRKTFRTIKYEQYKAQRKPTPSELSEQFPLTKELLTALGIKAFDVEDYEADDIIGTLASKSPKDVEVAIVTGDKDEFQLIDANVKVYFTKKGISELQVYDEAQFAQDYAGLKPKQIIDLKGLMGDTSDNIPGVPGVGPKTALKLITEYQSVENVLAHIDDVGGKSLKEKLNTNQEQALLSKELATICLTAPITTQLEEYKLTGMTATAGELIQDLGFRNLGARFAAVLGSATPGETAATDALAGGLFGVSETAPIQKWPQVLVQTTSQAQDVLTRITQSYAAVPLTYQVQGAIPTLALAEVQIAWEKTIYVFQERLVSMEPVYSYLAAPAAKICCDCKELYKIGLCQKFVVQGIREDLALADYLYEAGESSYSLTALSERYLAANCGGTVQDLASLTPIVLGNLAERSLEELYRQIELPLVSVLAQMESNGIAVDREMLSRVRVEMRNSVEQLEVLAHEQAGEEFNLKSPKQLGVLLFEKLGLPVLKKTKSGYSTDVSVLEQLLGQHPLIATILEHRKLSKLLSTYLEGLEPLINQATGRIHTHFQQMVTVTGRLSSTEPNLQNIPTRTEIGKKMREMFVPGEGYDELLSCDYSQVELRVLAHISQDKLLLDSFAHNQDVHARTAAEVFGVPLQEVTSTMRTRAKAVNFGIVYGISDYGLSKQLDVSRAEAAHYIEEYFKRYSGVKAYMEQMIATAKRQGYVETMFGRRRYLPDINHSNFNLRSFAERTAINTPIQGTAADIIKIAMVQVARALAQAQVKSRLLLQVHDELVLELVKSEEEQVAKLVKTTMEQAATLAVPLLADVATGKNWAETK